MWRKNFEMRPVAASFVGAVRNVATAIGLALALSGCGHPWGPNLDADAIACQGYGFYVGTPEFDQCMTFVSARREKRPVF
jgi:hypothetical protein